MSSRFRQPPSVSWGPVTVTVDGAPAERRRQWPEGVSPGLVRLMEAVCTEKELDALELKARGYGYKKSAELLQISKSALRERLWNAERKLLKAMSAAQSEG